VDVEPYTIPGTVSVIVKVTRDGGHPVRDARVRFAGKAANGGRTGNQGLAQVFAPVDLPGYFSAYARKGKRFGLSSQVGIGFDAPASASVPASLRDRG
jgi:hypothetical protein